MPLRMSLPVILAGGLLVLGAACDEDDFMAPELPASINISIGDCSGLRVGETCQLQAIVQSQDGNIIEDAQIHWRTPDITVATVDFQGKVTGVSKGVATIFAQSAPGPNVCQSQDVVCDTQSVSVSEQQEPGPEPPL